ncbi:hypothetical protein NEDG_01014 [Nematocida displodere]|uniref:Uncharacterized protein n=1 Tax=Nematocida displodere TaxID=1805483 RepID=A0A177EAD3_9MICR|nr:hypothetical protein NEDG_01014 [Nematocida displodere]
MRQTEEGVILECIIKTNVKSASMTMEEGFFVVAVESVPVDNRANKEVVEAMASLFSVKRASVSIITGHKSKHKSILIKGLTLDQVNQIKFR